MFAQPSLPLSALLNVIICLDSALCSGHCKSPPVSVKTKPLPLRHAIHIIQMRESFAMLMFTFAVFRLQFYAGRVNAL